MQYCRVYNIYNVVDCYHCHCVCAPIWFLFIALSAYKVTVQEYSQVVLV